MDSDESYHSESEVYCPDKKENNNDKENIGAQHEENQQNVQFTMASVQKYILSTSTAKHSEKKNRVRLTRLEKILSWGGRSQKNWGHTPEPADELNVLICHFMIEIKKKDGEVSLSQQRYNPFKEALEKLKIYIVCKKHVNNM